MMHLEHALQLLVLASLFLLAAFSSPVPWPEDKLEAINALRARGASEVSKRVVLRGRDTTRPCETSHSTHSFL